jgi:hypothetical protein
MLRLLPQPGEGQDPPKRRRGIPSPLLSLSADEVRHLRAAIRNIARTYGSLAALARTLGVKAGVLTSKTRPHPGLAVALWRLTGVSVEAMLSGKLAGLPAPALAPEPAPRGAS